MYCDKCGKEIKDDVKFCRYCGALMEAQSSNHQKGGPQTAKISEAEAFDAKRKIFGIAAIIVFAALLIIALSVMYINTDEKKILGDWVPVSGFHAPQEFPGKMTVSKDEINVEGYDGTYILNKDSQMLSLNVSIANKSFYYELEDNLLYLKDLNDANSEVGIYLNLSKASEEEVYEYSFGKSVAEENRLEEYLIGKWKCTGKGRKGRDLSGEYGSSTDYYIEFTEDDEGRHVRYNLPVPHREEDDSGYDIRDDNKLTLGSEKLNAFQFTPKSEEEMAVYCYDNDSYYDFEREY